MEIIGFSRHGFLYIQYKHPKMFGKIFSAQLNHSESYILEAFSNRLREFETLGEAKQTLYDEHQQLNATHSK